MHETSYLQQILILLAAAVVAVPIFQRLGMGTVLGYLIAGAIIGPWGLEFIYEVEDIRHIAEFGVIFLLFLIGIELKPSRLWSMRRMVFGLGSAQVLITGLVLAGLMLLFGFDGKIAIIVGFGLALSSTAFGLQILTERRQLNTDSGRATLSILLLQDLAVVPLLTLVSLLAEDFSLTKGVEYALLEAVLAIVVVLLVGRYLLTPILHLVASSRTSEVFIAAAVLAVLGISWLMDKAGLSMALGAFLAGLMLAESHYRHQIVADILPFRAILLGLFFMSVGMSINFGLLIDQTLLIAGLVLALLAIKIVLLLGLCHIFGLNKSDNTRVSFLLAQSGEFAFILFGLATIKGVLTTDLFQLLMLIVALTMAATPLLVSFANYLDRRFISKTDQHPLKNLEFESDQHRVIIAGFGRVGRRIAKLLDSSQTSYMALDNKPDRVARLHAEGIPVFFGDASRIDVLEAAGAYQASVLVITLVDPDAAERLVHVVHQHYPELLIYARAHDHEHCQALLKAGATIAISETMETSLQLGNLALEASGVPEDEIDQLLEAYRLGYYADIEDK